MKIILKDVEITPKEISLKDVEIDIPIVEYNSLPQAVRSYLLSHIAKEYDLELLDREIAKKSRKEKV